MKMIAVNKKAQFNYFLTSTYEAGLELKGSEVKSVRESGINLNDSFVTIRRNEAYLRNAFIKTYSKTNNFVLDERRDRKLLLHKDEIEKLNAKACQKGYTIIPVKAYFVKGYVKVEIALAKGKQLYDKSDAIKARDIHRDMLRQTKLS